MTRLDEAIQKLEEGRHKEAQEILERLRREEPDNPVVLYNLGMCYSERGRLKASIEALERCIELAPDLFNAYAALGFSYRRSGQTERALEVLEEGESKDPENFFVQKNIGSTERSSMSCVALDGRPLAMRFCDMESMLFYYRFSRKCDATEHLIVFSGQPKVQCGKELGTAPLSKEPGYSARRRSQRGGRDLSPEVLTSAREELADTFIYRRGLKPPFPSAALDAARHQAASSSPCPKPRASSQVGPDGVGPGTAGQDPLQGPPLGCTQSLLG